MGAMADSVHVRMTVPTSVDDPRAMAGRMTEVVVRPLWPRSRGHTHTVDLWVSAVELQEDGETPILIGVAHFAGGALDNALPGDAFHVVGAHVHETFSATGTITGFLDKSRRSPISGPRSLQSSDAMVTFRRTGDTPTYPKVPGGSGALIGLGSMSSHMRGELTFEANRFHRGRMWFRLHLPPGGFAESSAGDQLEVLDCPAAPWLVGADGRIELILENVGP